MNKKQDKDSGIKRDILTRHKVQDNPKLKEQVIKRTDQNYIFKRSSKIQRSPSKQLWSLNIPSTSKEIIQTVNSERNKLNVPESGELTTLPTNYYTPNLISPITFDYDNIHSDYTDIDGILNEQV